MLLIELITSYFLKPQAGSCISLARIAGYLLLLCGGGIGLFFLFEALVPLIGYLESGAAITALLLAAGVFLLVFERKKKPSPRIDNIFEEAQAMLKSVDIEKSLKNNVHKVLLVSFLGGLVLSQIKDGNKIAYLKDKLPHLKDFLK